VKAVPTSFSFECTACGKCCNSGPQLSLPELFHHERRFIGCLTLRRVKLLRRGDEIGQGVARGKLTADDEREYTQLAERLLHPLPVQPGEAPQALLLAIQAFYDPSAARCPQLSPDNTCSVHVERKPGACSVAPLEAWLPDRLQHYVLAGRRRAAEYHGTDCIRPGETRGQVVTRRLAVVQREAHESLARRRADLQRDKLFWGAGVFAQLARELLSDRAALARIPLQGFVSIPPVPVLALLAQVSERCRLRCLAFLEAQRGLIDAALEARSSASAAPGDVQVRATTLELEALARSTRTLLSVLTRPHAAQPATAHAAEVEAWLGLENP
jgi:hypothetical protein